MTAGARVWRDYDQATLDLECNPARSIAGHDAIIPRYAAMSEASRKRFPGKLGLHYGPEPMQTLDIFPAARANAPVLFFIHGGGWRSLSKDESSFVADGFVPHGVTVVTISHTLIPQAPLADIVRETRSALAWVWNHIGEHGGDRHRIYVSGHSAGGHLGSMLLRAGWHDAFGVPANVVRGAVLVSGNYDLQPLRLSYRNEWLHLDEAGARALSGNVDLPKAGGPLLTAWGELESRQYKLQGRELAGAWRAQGLAGETMEQPGLNHLEAVLDLAKPDSALTRATLFMMGQG